MCPPVQPYAARSVNVYHVKQCLHCVDHLHFFIYVTHSAHQHTLPSLCYLFFKIYKVVYQWNTGRRPNYFHVLPNTENLCQIQKVLVGLVECVCVLTCPVNPSSYIYSPECFGWLSDRARHQVGKGFCCRDGNQSPIRPISARMLID